jgi:hypothetical protein
MDAYSSVTNLPSLWLSDEVKRSISKVGAECHEENYTALCTIKGGKGEQSDFCTLRNIKNIEITSTIVDLG